MSDTDITSIVSQVLPADPKDTQPFGNIPERRRRIWIPAVWKPVGSGGGAPKISGGFEADIQSGIVVPRSFNRPDQRYTLDETELIARREARAAAEYALSVVLLGENNLFEVRSISGNNYDVASDLSSCDCPDKLRLSLSGQPEVPCKHMLIVDMALSDPIYTDGLNWSTDKAAEAVGVDVSTIQKACRDGLISASKVHNVWVITPAGGASLQFIFTHLTPTLLSVDPIDIPAGSPDTSITITGTGFCQYSQVVWDAQSVLTTTFDDPTQITASLLAMYVTSPGTHTLRVENAFRGGATSEPVNFIVT